MSLCLLKILKEWIGILFVLLNPGIFNDKEVKNIDVVYNINSVNMTAIATPVEYETEKIYNDKLPSTTRNVITEGQVGTVYEVDGENIVVNEPVNEVIEIGTGRAGTYSGSVTGYGADCIGCSGVVSCKTPTGYHNIKKNSVYYSDSQYGELRVLAADLTVFECGTVVEVDSTNGEPFMGIVMDTGSALKYAWNKYGRIVVDVAFNSEDDSGVYDITDRTGKVQFNIKRWGW